MTIALALRGSLRSHLKVRGFHHPHSEVRALASLEGALGLVRGCHPQ